MAGMHPALPARLAGLLVVIALLLAACANADVPTIPTATPAAPTPRNGADLVIGASFPILDPFLTTVADALQASAKAIGNVELEVVSADGRRDGQLEQVQ